MIELEVYKGLPFVYTVKLMNKLGQSIDITDGTIIMKVRSTIESDEVLIDCNISNGRIKILDGPGGEFMINVEPGLTAGLTEYSCFDILVITATEEYFLIAKDGKIKSRNYVSR